ncbi:hypothetical protein [Canibacter zhoujuaniae]|uniref:hypothetical protein n=1 Tax=Canibacter zhoujuaniae TaxID=2708343 RepID=UPI0014208BD2|nr:hypothetical protein [Canibacter zhoujuaniae]
MTEKNFDAPQNRGKRRGPNDRSRDSRGSSRAGGSRGFERDRPRKDDRPRRDDRPSRDDRPRREERSSRAGGQRRDGDFRGGGRGEFRSYRDRNSGEHRGGKKTEHDSRAPRGSHGSNRQDDRGDRRSGERRFSDRGERRFSDRGDRRFNDGGKRGSASKLGRGGTRGNNRSDRGGIKREFTEAERLQHELRPVRGEHRDPEIPQEVTAKDLNPGARNELKTLEKENAERVARHLAMVSLVINIDPELAHQHAISAARKAGRIPVVRETLAMTAYALEDFAMALRELRTYRRISGKDMHIALEVDCERGLGRPEKALEVARQVDPKKLSDQERVYLAIAVSGARLDLGQLDAALAELEIPQLNPKKVFPWSPELFSAYAAVLEDLGRAGEAAKWEQLASRASEALLEHAGGDRLEVTDAAAYGRELAEIEAEIAAAETVAAEDVAEDTAETAALTQEDPGEAEAETEAGEEAEAEEV